MSGLRMICKMYGGMTVKDANGKTIKYVWDYEKDEPVKESDLKDRAKQLRAIKKSEKIKQEQYKKDQPSLF